MKIRRVDVLGVGISAINMEMALGAIRQWVETSDRQYVCVTGVHGVMESQADPELRHIHNRSGLTTPDGMPMVWAGRAAGAEWMERVYGPDLMLEVLSEAEKQGWSSFFYGGAPDVPELLVARLIERFPGLKVAGTYSPPFRPLTDAEVTEVADTINRSAATLVWVGLSTPKQERWMAQLRPLLEAPVLFGVGAAFDFHAGRVSQAPSWMQKSGLEWLYRLLKEPRRLWRRYLTNNPRFVLSIFRHRPHLIVPDQTTHP
jgi:N-acetylglucosaminyldiphosphoundecaprenol N-acetyl-beta-D-mannosaminyltransferase